MHTIVIGINNRQGAPYNLFQVTGFYERVCRDASCLLFIPTIIPCIYTFHPANPTLHYYPACMRKG